MAKTRPTVPGWYWFKGHHVTGAARFLEWSVLQVKDEGVVLTAGSDILYQVKDLTGEWVGDILAPGEGA